VDGAPLGVIRAKMAFLETPSEGKPSLAKHSANPESVTRVGLDLAKNVFQLHAVDAGGAVVLARSVRRAGLLKLWEKLPRCEVAMEACSSAHHWGRALVALGFSVGLIPPAYVKPYVRRNKNDAADAAAICEAASRPNMRFVPLRSVENLAQLMRHRARELLVAQRTQLLNAIRGHLAEVAAVALQGAQHAYALKRLISEGCDDNGEIRVQDCMREALLPVARQIDALDWRIEVIDKQMLALARADATARRLMTIPGVGPLTAQAPVAAIQDASGFANGREFAAYLGLAPRQNSSGGKERLGRITKMGDRYLRKLLVVGACATLRHRQGQHGDALRVWATKLFNCGDMI